jgi:transposase-like protein/ribosomal protein L37AE/L43A
MGKGENKPDYEEMSWLIFKEQFQNENDCYKWLFNTRWPNGFICPRCGGKEYWRISTRELYKCVNCRHQVSLTAGTIFHKTRTSLMKWFMLVFRMATSKTGVSINEMRRELEIKDYKTVWTMAHKVRKAMADRDARYTLAGLVEIDESFFGPRFSGKRGRGAERKELVIVAVSIWTDQKGKERPGFAHAFVAENAKAETIENILKRLGVPKEEVDPLIKAIRSDGWRSYQTVSKGLDLLHHRAVLRDPKDSMKLLPWTHRVIANAKAVFAGPHRGVSKKHIQKYLSEVCYRFNRRFWEREAFHRLLYACASTTTVTRDELMRASMGELSP